MAIRRAVNGNRETLAHSNGQFSAKLKRRCFGGVQIQWESERKKGKGKGKERETAWRNNCVSKLGTEKVRPFLSHCRLSIGNRQKNSIETKNLFVESIERYPAKTLRETLRGKLYGRPIGFHIRFRARCR